jgi:hypothetical protein
MDPLHRGLQRLLEASKQMFKLLASRSKAPPIQKVIYCV